MSEDIGAMAPKRKNEIIVLSIRSIIAGTLSACLTGTTVGISLGE